MNQKLMINLEVVKGEHTFVFSMPVGVPLGAAYDASAEVLNAIVEMAKQAAQNAQPAAAEEKSSDSN
jgi:hypothetical protein